MRPRRPVPHAVLGARIGVDPARVALVERDRAWQLAAQAIGRARSGHGSALLIEGPRGIGKSGLMAAIRSLAAESGTLVLSAAGRRREKAFPFGVVLQLIERGLDTTRSNGERAWLPELSGPEAAFDQLHGLYRCCAHLAATSPLALMIDDVDLADEPSLRFLLYLTERLADLPAAVILAADTVSRRRAPELLGELARHPLTTRWQLKPLTKNGTARRLAKMWLLGISEETAEEIHLASGGNPFLVDALAAALAVRAGKPSVTPVHELAPAEIAEWAMTQAAELDSRAPALLTAVAVLGQDCELRHGSALANLDPETTWEIVDALREIGLLAAGDCLSFSEPVVATAIEAALAPGVRALGNLHAARLLAADEAAPEQVAAHLLLAARTGSDWVVDALRAAAAAAFGRAAPSDAGRYLRRALEEPPARDDRMDVVLELARAEAMAGEPQAAVRLRLAAERLRQAPEQPRAALTSGRALFALGRPEQALAVFERGLENTKDVDPDVADRLRAAHATALWFTELGNGATRRLPSPPAGAETAGDRAVLALNAIEGAIRGTRCTDVRELAERALANGALLDDETADGLSYYLAAGALAYAEELELAEAALTAAVEEAQSRGSVLGLGTASYAGALVTLMRGRLPDAVIEAERALTLERRGWRAGLGGARVVLATALIERGDLDTAERHLDAAATATSESDPVRLSLLSARGRLRLLSGEADKALADFLACGALADRAGATNPAVAPWRSNAGLALAVIGDFGEAERLIEAELKLAEAFGAPGPVGRGLRALGSIRDPKPAREALEAAVETLQGSQAALERATALVDFGAALRRSGGRRAARKPLVEGLELAQTCGAEVLSARALREMKLAGARPRRIALHGLESLTARERQVASLAADGLSNREIAGTLVVTLKTVEWHLSRCYQKLGVQSRGELLGPLGRTE